MPISKTKLTVITKLFLLIVIAFMIFGCARKNYTRSYVKYVKPITVEGRKCAQECKKIKLLELQVSTQEYLTYKGKALERTAYVLKGARESSIEEEYKECFRECGGTTKSIVY